MTTIAAGPSHAPERGPLARWLGPFHVTGVFWYRLHLWAARFVPRWLLPILTLTFTAFFFVALHRIRRAIAANLVAVLGPCGTVESGRRVWRTLHSFAWCLTERYEYFAGREAPTVEVEGFDDCEGLFARPGGLIVLTAHVGNWEVASSVLTARVARAVHLVREVEADPAAQRFFFGLVERRGLAGLTVHFAGDPRLGLVLHDALSRGEVVALQGDRPREGGQTIQTRLFGRSFEVPAGPFVLARATGSPLLPAFAHRTARWRYRIHCQEPVHVASTDDRRADLAQAAAAVTAMLEAVIRREPHQWFCFREVWPEST